MTSNIFLSVSDLLGNGWEGSADKEENLEDLREDHHENHHENDKVSAICCIKKIVTWKMY